METRNPAVAILGALFIVYWIVSVGLFWAYRKRTITEKRSWSMILTSAVVGAFTVLVSFARLYVGKENFPCDLHTWTLHLFLPSYFGCYMLRALRARVLSGPSFRSQETTLRKGYAEIKRLYRWIHALRTVNYEGFIVVAYFTLLAYGSLIYFLLQPLLRDKMERVGSGCLLKEEHFYTAFSVALAYVVGTVALGFPRCRGMPAVSRREIAAYGLRIELTICTAIWLLFGVPFVAINSFSLFSPVEEVLPTSIMSSVMIVASTTATVTVPALLNMRSKSPPLYRAMESTTRAAEREFPPVLHLRAVMEDDKSFAVFHDHCSRQGSHRILEFSRKVAEFREAGRTQKVEIAKDLCHRYLDPSGAAAETSSRKGAFREPEAEVSVEFEEFEMHEMPSEMTAVSCRPNTLKSITSLIEKADGHSTEELRKDLFHPVMHSVNSDLDDLFVSFCTHYSYRVLMAEKEIERLRLGAD